ncbi:hypothetical protein KC950_00825 [Candidatus Saccharibacteria bacterium]|nr:hypothetical protein [Candidatus Saccharibacteria bacterium]
MTATNHALTGAVIAATVVNPALGLTLAFLSHFALDALPHFGAHTVASVKSKEFRYILTTDGIVLTAFLVIVGFAGYKVGYDWWLLPLGGLLAAIPDIMWLSHYKADLSGADKEWDIIRKFHKTIQQWERSWGWIVEMVWFVVFTIILNRILFS